MASQADFMRLMNDPGFQERLRREQQLQERPWEVPTGGGQAGPPATTQAPPPQDYTIVPGVGTDPQAIIEELQRQRGVLGQENPYDINKVDPTFFQKVMQLFGR